LTHDDETNRLPPSIHRDARFDVLWAHQTRKVSFVLATLKDTDTADDVDWSETAEVLIEQTPCHLRIVLDPAGEDHDLLVEQRRDHWAIFVHAPGGGDPLCIIETTTRGAVVLDDTGGPPLLTRGEPPISSAAETPASAPDRGAVVLRLEDKAQTAGLTAEDLDDLVHELASNTAADVNNGGLFDQIQYLVDELGVQNAEREIDALLEAKRQEKEDNP
jgi:hypothetical protein